LVSFYFDLLGFRALRSAIATACLRGRPVFISSETFERIAFFELPFFKGMAFLSSGWFRLMVVF